MPICRISGRVGAITACTMCCQCCSWSYHGNVKSAKRDGAIRDDDMLEAIHPIGKIDHRA
ncbi:hypothetical protein BDB00DRAFT_824448 [Zychaea mexicana]|uniref:uncharacterized protein n=1 Tax=Zychaea mexicana TaxID=64656 RepID=UPI0022FE2532|nr:uncharacterized protein BDB00DRAFT_824448 [Zychaea mexicana]KAI9493112.1 hypothetical protein BDB00DRAFT_824448 [Zychaea mexicana]